MQKFQMKGIATNYLLNKQRRLYVKSLANEYLSILAILYGDQLEIGQTKVSDYGTMTMLEAENELRIRAMMYKGRRIRKQRDLRDEAETNERDMLEQLKRLNN